MRISDWSSDVCSSDLTHSLISDFWLFREAEPEDIHWRADILERQCRHLPQTRVPAIRSDHQSCADILSVLQSDTTRSEERRVGKECVSTCRSRWSPYH